MKAVQSIRIENRSTYGTNIVNLFLGIIFLFDWSIFETFNNKLILSAFKINKFFRHYY